MNEVVDPGIAGGRFIRHDGIAYLEAMRLLGQMLEPKGYLEIGTGHGHSLATVDCATVAVDPRFQISDKAIGSKPACFLFQMTSDAFFRDHRLGDYLRDGVDLAFLDGLHRFEYLFRDFYNTEPWCRRNSVILLHDCLPTTNKMTSRNKIPGEWAGDVWKMIPALRKHRPDLKIVYFDCPPTGLVAVTNLDPGSGVLKERYFGIVDEFVDLAPETTLPELYASLPIVSSRELQVPEQASRYFGI